MVKKSEKIFKNIFWQKKIFFFLYFTLGNTESFCFEILMNIYQPIELKIMYVVDNLKNRNK